MVKLILIRHGEAPKKSLRIGAIQLRGRNLTQRGKRQVEKLANRLKNKDITKIISSDLKRTVQTAKIISKVLKKEFVLDSRIRDRIPSRESNEEFIKRCNSFLEDTKKEKGNILVSSHGSTNKTILAISTGNRKKGAELFNSIKQNHSCINILEFEGNRWKIQRINDTDHLL